MLGDALQRQPLSRIFLQQFRYQVPGVVGHARRPPYVDALDTPVRRAVTVRLERGTAH